MGSDFVIETSHQNIKKREDELLISNFKMDFDAGESVLEEKLLVCPIEANRQNTFFDNAIEKEIKKFEDEECKSYIKLEKIHIEHENEEHQKFIKCEELIIKDDKDELDEQDDVYIDEPDFVDVCSECTPIVAVNDNPVPMGIVDRAAQSVPKGTLALRSSDVNGTGIYSHRHLKKGVRLGPYQGHTTKVQSTNSYAWKISGGKLVDASEETSSNYLRYVNYAKVISEQNLVAVQYKGELYYQTSRDIQKGEELLIYFGGNQDETYHYPIEENFDKKIFICQLCQLGMRYESHQNSHQMFCQIRTNEINDVFLCKHFAASSDVKYAGEGTQIESVESTKKYETYSEGTLLKYEGYDVKTCYKTTLRLHKEKHNQTNTFKCTPCDYESVSKLELNRHQHRVKLDQKRVLKCTDCDYETYFKSKLKRHQLIHSSTDVFKCTHCSYETNTNKKLYKHRVKHDKKKVLKLRCTNCFYETDSKINLKVHQQNHNLANVFKCEDCNFKTLYKRSLISHMQTHSTINLFKCTHCSYETNTGPKLHGHKIKHDQKRLLKCTDCDYETYFKFRLKRHRLKHNSTDVFTCADCNFETHCKGSLTTHIQTHSLINRFKCTHCSYETNTTKKLYKHKVKHNQKRLLKCTDCDYETYFKSNLKGHQRKHKSTDVFKCADCNFRTCYKRSLIAHIQTHSSINRFKCTHCSYETSTNNNLCKHRVKHDH